MLDAAAGPAVRPDGQPAAAGTAMILSVATNLPGGRLTSAELAERYGISEEWIVARTGIRERRQAAPSERISDYATRAGALALQTAGADPADLDLVIVATMTPDELTPNTAPLVAHYAQRGIVHRVPGTGTIEGIATEIQRIIGR